MGGIPSARSSARAGAGLKPLKVDGALQGVKVLGTTEDLASVVDTHYVDEVILASTSRLAKGVHGVAPPSRANPTAIPMANTPAPNHRARPCCRPLM